MKYLDRVDGKVKEFNFDENKIQLEYDFFEIVDFDLKSNRPTLVYIPHERNHLYVGKEVLVEDLNTVVEVKSMFVDELDELIIEFDGGETTMEGIQFSVVNDYVGYPLDLRESFYAFRIGESDGLFKSVAKEKSLFKIFKFKVDAHNMIDNSNTNILRFATLQEAEKELKAIGKLYKHLRDN